MRLAILVILIILIPTVTAEEVYPKLSANIFQSIYDIPACREGLSVYSDITRGALLSSRNTDPPGFDYGTYSGFGSFSDVVYDLGSNPGRYNDLYVGAKIFNPDVKIYSHGSIAKQEAAFFTYGTSSPQRWFADSTSPRWFAYTPLIELQEAVTDSETTIFKFLKEPVQTIESWDTEYFPNGPLYDHWIYFGEDANFFDWYYISFFDNDNGAGRGTVEIMAIDHITYDDTYAYVTVATKQNGERTLFGAPQTYSMSARAGIVPTPNPEWGALAFATNRYCRSEIEDTTNCDQLRVDGINWPEAKAFYVSEFLMKAEYEDTYLNDGVLLDADSQGITPKGFKFRRKIDENLDGIIDNEEWMNDQIPHTYIEFYNIIKSEAEAYGREDGTDDEFLIVNNGYLNPDVDNRPLNGVQYEDFNGGIQGTYNEELAQYVRSYTDPNFLDEPISSWIRERDRRYYPGGEYFDPDSELGINQNNFDAHRDIMAMTLIMGNASYGHTYSHSTGIPICDRHYRDDWFDEFSVDENGVSSKHEDYDAPLICFDFGEGEQCVKNRFYHIGWLGGALGTGYEMQGYPNVYRRDFDNGIALLSLDSNEITITLERYYKKILGVDPDNNGILFNDGSTLNQVTLNNREGIILITLNCEGGDINGDGIVENDELVDSINSWFLGEIEMLDIIAIIDNWLLGC